MFRTFLAVLALSVVASASTVSYNTSAGSLDVKGNPVSASATVTTSDGGVVTVSLTNNQTGIFAADQLLSDFFFTLSSTPVSVNTTTTPLNTSGALINVASGGIVTAAGGSYVGWSLTDIGGQVHLDSLPSGPSQTIIGSVSNSPNASITGNHNPYINGTANFSFIITGVTSGTTISNGIFSFGTDTGDNITGCVVGAVNCHSTIVPEPVTSGLVGLGLMSLFFLRRRFQA